MAISQHRARRKSSGGKYNEYRKKRVFELGSKPTLTLLGETTKKFERVRGGLIKTRLLRTNIVNVIDKQGKFHKATIKTVKENPADPNFTRRNIITKGSIVETNVGKVKITSRPGQVGTLNGTLI